MKRIIIILSVMLFTLTCHAFEPASVQSGTKAILDDVICEWYDTSVYLVFPSNFTQDEAWAQEHELNDYFSSTPGYENLYILMEKSDPKDPNINMNIYWDLENNETEEKVYHIDCNVFKVTIIQKPLIIQNTSLTKLGNLNGGNAAVSLTNRQQGVTYNLLRNGVFVQEIPGWISSVPITQQGTYTLQAVVYNQNNYPATISQGPILMPGSVSFYPNGEEDIEEPEMEEPVLALTQTQNYITHFVSHDGSTSSGSLTAKYYDGLGRPNETVQFAANPTKKDLVTYQEYDALGRESNAWIPAVASGNNGGFISFTNFKTKANSTYAYGTNYETAPYAISVYEASPLNRISEQYGPGELWHSNKRAVKTEHLANLESSSELNCYNYTVTDHATIDTIMTIKNMGEYAGFLLYVTRTTDEDGNFSLEFKNKLNQVILTRQLNGTNKVPHDTYYIYDDFGNLKAVLPPIASDAMKTSGSWISNTDPTLRNYAYLYRYDSSNRCIAKKLPGAGFTRLIYDKSNRLIFSQDAKKQWSFSIPDSLGRVVITGTFKTINGSSNIVNSDYENSLIVARFATNGAHNYYTIYKDVNTLNLGTPVYLTTNYYDNYNFMAQSGFSRLAYSILTGTDAEFNTRDTSANTTKGLLTGSIVGDAAGGTTKIYSAMYYDYRGRMIQSRGTNHLGGTETDCFIYTFTGNPKKKLHIHKKTNTSSEVKELYTYDYDHAERLTRTTHQLNGGAIVILAENYYDDLGQLKTKKQHGSTAILSNYKYNLRGWLTNIFSGRFTQNLHYNDRTNTLNTKLYNGNISAMTWKFDTGSTLRGYKFIYDNLNQLTEANYGEGETLASNTGRYTEKVTGYDKHGNIQGIKRYGKTSSGYGLIDDLSFGYTGNQMKYVNDAITTSAVGQTFHFINGTNSTGNEYTYDGNGNMIKDLNKNISNIKYNLLNLPKEVLLSNNRSAEYLYNAAGVKFQVTHNEPGKTTVTDYCGNMIYENGELKKILTEEGYITLSGSTPTYHYYLKDHLGNNRVVFNINSSNVLTIEQVNSYYPFGGLFDQTAETVQDYKYNGKELDRTFGIDLYDYSARYMDGALGRFTTIDPLAEKYYGISPYVYCANNPIKFVDPDGKSPYYNKFGKFLGVDVGGFSGQIMITSDEAFKYSRANNVSISESNFIQDLDLSARTLSSIYTHIIGQAGFSTDLLENEAISVIGKNDTFNSPNAGTDFLKTSFTMKEGSKFKISLKDDISSRLLLNTVENAINAIGDHEYTGHGVMKLGPNKDHYKVYEYQMNQPVYEKTTESYKEEMMRQYQMYILEEFK